jgi:polyphosphate kinase
LVAPVNYRDSVLSLIDTEISNHRSGLPAEIIFKINNLEDPMVCSKLIEASQAGVPIRLLVRSICTLLPQVKGLTDTIEVRSVVDRFLEHSRTLYFRAGAEEPALGKFFLCSADLMRRNLSGRVEVAVGLENPGHKRRIYDVLEIMWNAKKNNWYMDSEGKYHRLETLDPDELSGQQQLMIRH